MMSLAAIRQVSRDAAIVAARDNRIPFTVEKQDVEDWRKQYKQGRLRLPFPFLGEYVPQGWKRTDRDALFVDKSGMGGEGEPALTIQQLLRELAVDKAYAIVEEGQFQLYLGEYERDDESAGNEAEFAGELTSDEEDELDDMMEGSESSGRS